MIPARKGRLFSWWFARHAEKRMRRQFSSIWLRGLDELRCDLAAGPVLVVCNHSSWWDPMLAILLAHRVLRADGYALMEASNLRRLPFLGRVGGFGVDREDENDGKVVVRYGAELLDRPGRLVWVFPQGRERPASEPLCEFHRGAAAMAATAPARVRVVPTAIRYEYGNVERARLLAVLGPSFVAGSDVEAERVRQRDAVTEQLEVIHRALGAGDWPDWFAPLFLERPPWLSLWAERSLARMARY
jgi:1-acyl-sn-glycerol-3-phosphate acyltransferase